MSRKWTAEDFEQLDAATNPVDTANIEGNIASLSPVTKERHLSYFEGEIDDGTCKLRLVGFSRKVSIDVKVVKKSNAIHM